MKRIELEKYLGKNVTVTMIPYFNLKGPKETYTGILQTKKEHYHGGKRYNCKGTNLWFCLSHINKVIEVM